MTGKMIGIACCATLALAMMIAAPAARADDLDQASQFTFNQPVAFPGNIVLPAGTYWFVLADPINAPNLVDVFNEDRSNLVTTLWTEPTLRDQRIDHSMLAFAQPSNGQPVSLLDWYYTDRLTGHELVYSSPWMEDKLGEEERVNVVANDVPEVQETPAESVERGRLLHADDVMQAALRAPEGIPQHLLDQARCVVVMPSVVNAAFVVGATYGRGVMVCRTGANNSGAWGLPAMYELEGASLGPQAGGQATDYVLLVMNRRGMESLLHGKARLGADVPVAAGPVGRVVAAQTDTNGYGADILAYSRTRGIFAGASLEGSTLGPDVAANSDLYGPDLTAEEIVREPAAGPQKFNQPLVALLDQSSPQLKS